MPSILITVHRDRFRAGTLQVLDAAGRSVLETPCLARAAAEVAAAAGNPKRDPLKRRGDTPAGSYVAPQGVVALDPPQKGFGGGWIPLDPVGGEAQAAENAGRRGLAIHGGRGDKKLVPTAGCVRVLDADFARIAGALRGAKGFVVEVREAGNG